MLFQGQWGTVCNNYWYNNYARVVCRQLGYDLNVTTNINALRQGKPGTGQIWLDHIQCSGSEERLDECSHIGWGQHYCNHQQDAWVQCFNSSQPEGKQHN